MQPLVQKRVLLVTLAVCFLVVTGLMFYSSQEREKEIWLERAFKFVLYPFQKAIHAVTTFVTDSWTTINELGALQRENDEMRKRLSELATELSQLEQLRAENERLRELLQFKAASTLELIPVEVVARNPRNTSDTITIDKGSNFGLTRNMPVITAEGLAGRLLRVEPFSSEVILLTDPRPGNSMSGVIERTRELVYIYGGGKKGTCLVKPSDLSVKLQTGDRILTSESSLFFPKNLVIGTLVEVYASEDGYEQYAYLEPATDFSRLEYLYVVKEK
ncbi:rod shape-determining protein MreC [Capillibacterium thermochitinicola]|uniref:rod shape-determining protein MreC n=1 Tax=Capillibacterium thermochitinicola TaxID=2699427 RepID=UPI001E4E76D6|nr:rod shape-determining protein MreC [Capillibacterium thermochitinicola]